MLKERCVSIIFTAVILALLLLGCANPTTVQSLRLETEAVTTGPQANTEATKTQITKEPIPFPLSVPGPYSTSSREFTFVDESRSGREIGVTIWYPALNQTNALPDLSGAPYPLILTEMDSGRFIFRSHLASHGFVMASITVPGDFNKFDFFAIDWPLDFLFVLDQIANNPPEGLEGVIDSNHTGVVGYSFGGFISLALSGVRIDPEYYLSYCEQVPAMKPPLEAWYIEYFCDLAKKWDEFAAYVGNGITASDDGLWQPVSDKRIVAVMPMAADGAWLYGERGLAMADRPAFFIQAAEDSPYQPIEAAFIFENIGSPERSMVSFIGQNHESMLVADQVKRMRHFATAYFGAYLQGRQDYAEYFSEDFVAQFDDLAWGVYSDK